MAKSGGSSGNVTWPLNPSKKPTTKKQKTDEANKKSKSKTKKSTKEGLGPSEVALWATSPDP